jgi:ubiquitin-conjugating enzyme E2 variant
LKVNLELLPGFEWKYEKNIKDVLREIKRFMDHPSNKKRPQPPEGATYKQ